MPFRINVDVTAIPTTGQSVGPNSYEIERLANSLYSSATEPASTDIIPNDLLFDFDIGNNKSYPGSGTTITDSNQTQQIIQRDLALVYEPSDSSSYDENGTILNDLSGNENLGQLNGGIVYDSTDGSLVLNGIDGYISTTTQFNNPQIFSIGIWIKTAATLGKIIGFTSSRIGQESSSYDRQLYFGAGGKLYFGVYSTEELEITAMSSTIPLNDNDWYYVVATFSNGIMKLYIDGAYNGQLAAPSAENYSGYWKIGSYAYGGWPNSLPAESTYPYPSGNYFNGKIGPVHIYKIELTEEQVRRNYNAYCDAKGKTPILTGPWDAVSTTRSFVDETEIENKAYHYRSRFTQSNGKISPWSPVVTSLSGSQTSPPNAPNLSAVATTNSVTLAFLGTAGIKHSIRSYTVEKSTDLINWDVLDSTIVNSVVVADATTAPQNEFYIIEDNFINIDNTVYYTHAGLNENAVYYYRVKFLQLNGIESPFSPVATIRTLSTGVSPEPPVPPDPEGPSVITTIPTVVNVTISEDAGGTGTYSFSRSHNNPTGTNRLFAWVSSGDGILPITSVTYNSIPMTLMQRFSSSEGQGGTRFVSVYSLMDPAIGINTATVTTSDGRNARIEAFFVSVSGASNENSSIVSLGEYDSIAPYLTTLPINAHPRSNTQLFMMGARWRNSAADIVPSETTQITVDTEGLNAQSSRASLTYLNSNNSIENLNLVWGADYGGVTQLGLAIPGIVQTVTPPATDVIFSYDPGNPASFTVGSTNLNDLGNNNNDASLVNGIFYIGNENSGIFNLDGLDDYIQTSSLLSNPQEFTIDIWFKTSGSNGKKIIGFENTNTQIGASQYDRHLYVGTDDILRFGVWDGGAKIAASNNPVISNKWYNAIITYKTGGFSLYIDGVFITNVTSSVAQSYSGYWKIGAFKLSGWINGSDGYFAGKIGIARVYNRILTSSEISGNYNANLIRFGTPNAPAVNLFVGSESSITISVTPTPITGTTVTNYVIERSPNGTDSWQQINTINSSATSYSYTDSALTSSTIYFYRARFSQNNGENSPNSPAVSAKTSTVSSMAANGLLFSFDFNNPASYPGTGSDVTDVYE